MIHLLSEDKADQKDNIDKLISEKESVDYSNVIVKKPWGYEYLVFQNDNVAIWMLHLVRKRKTSMHCHPHKSTSLILLSGKAVFHYPSGKIELDPFDGVVIGPGVFHSTEAFNQLPIDPVSENGIWVLEIETPPQKSDLVRMQDAYGRAGRSYEGTDQMVYDPEHCLRLETIEGNKPITKKFFDYIFTIQRGLNPKISQDALVSIVGKVQGSAESNLNLKFGGITQIKEIQKNSNQRDFDNYLFLTIEKEPKTVKVSDYVINCLANLGIKQIFAVSGGGAMHLVDSVGKSDRVEYVAVHHEQAAAMAAEGYSRAANIPGAVLVTTGPGGTNTITGVCGAWIDSIPMIILSGQVTSDMLSAGTELRQFGIQETDIVGLVKPITKYAVTVMNAADTRYHIEKAIYLATSGRPGPVWVDIPLDIQSKMINPEEQRSFDPNVEFPKKEINLKDSVARAIEMLKESKRPVLFSGYGIRLAKAEKLFAKLVEALQMPLVSSWTASDLIPTENPLCVGRSGVFGDRAGNFTVQNADLLFIIGSRMSVPIVGYNFKNFAREAKRIVVDISEIEAKKPYLRADLPVVADAKAFIEEMLRQLDERKISFETSTWLKRCQQWREKYPVVLPEYRENKNEVNSFYFIDLLSKKLGNDAMIVTDMGTSFTCTMQTFRIKKGQRLFTSSGHASMGFGLPGTIGACFANNKKRTICINGDGGLQMNIQELQTMVQYKLPITLFVFNNKGYLTIKLMQQNHFGRYVGSEPSSGVGAPNFVKVAEAYGIKATRISNQEELEARIDDVLAEPGPFLCEIMMPEDQPLIPRVSSIKKPDGSIAAKPLEDLYPFLSREEFLDNMIVKPIEPLK